MEHCDGRTHSEMTDAYDSYSYPCPGPDKCANAAAMLKQGEGPFKNDEKAALRKELEETKKKLREANEELAWRRPSTKRKKEKRLPNGDSWEEHCRKASEPEGRTTGLHRDSMG